MCKSFSLWLPEGIDNHKLEYQLLVMSKLITGIVVRGNIYFLSLVNPLALYDKG